MAAHESVLRQEAIDALVLNASGFYVDCTYGRGGHSQLILDRLNEQGRLLVIDKDLSAISDAEARFGNDARVHIAHGSFRDFKQFALEAGMPKLDGIFIDLGVSSPQLDEAERGFSFSHGGPLDMRMDQSQGETASEWLMRADERDIRYIIRRYGEEKFAKRIANKVIEFREENLIETTADLVDIIRDAIPFEPPGKHPATRTFQAIRIFINRELEDLETCLEDVVPMLTSGGRFVAISFHSLEDRIVKRFIRDMARGEQLPSRLPIRDDQIKRYFKIIGKPVKPSEAEVERNRRSRSSIMRIAERLVHAE